MCLVNMFGAFTPLVQTYVTVFRLLLFRIAGGDRASCVTVALIFATMNVQLRLLDRKASTEAIDSNDCTGLPAYFSERN